jgi:hypothetical protein
VEHTIVMPMDVIGPSKDSKIWKIPQRESANKMCNQGMYNVQTVEWLFHLQTMQITRMDVVLTLDLMDSDLNC